MYRSIVRFRTRNALRATMLGLIGYILSPLSWWNDPFINIPIALVIAYLLSLIDPQLFSIGFFIGYLATNIAGLTLLTIAVEDYTGRVVNLKDCILRSMLWGVVYTIVVTLLIQVGVIGMPSG